jgi:hypothetical protein
LSQAHWHRNPSTVPHYVNGHNSTNLMLIKHAEQIVGVSHFLTIDSYNYIAQLYVAVFRLSESAQTRICGSPAGSNLPNQNAFGNRQVDLVPKCFDVPRRDSEFRSEHLSGSN